MNMLDELKIITSKLGHFPTYQDLLALKEHKLSNSIVQSGIKISEYAEMLGEKTATRRGYWTEEKILEEVKIICDELGGWPSKNEWQQNYSNIRSAMYRDKGSKYFREKLGITNLASTINAKCLHCEKPFTPPVASNSTRQKYCCEECHINYFRIRNNARNAIKIKQPKTCPICSKEFVPKTTTKQKYCERRCYINFRKRITKSLTTCLEYLGESKECTANFHLGYNPEELLQHLGSYDSWNSLKTTDWHLDHIFPFKAFLDHNITDPKIICCLENLQPLSSEDNAAKGSKYDITKFQEWIATKI